VDCVRINTLRAAVNPKSAWGDTKSPEQQLSNAAEYMPAKNENEVSRD
jgi:hypothetical protein